MKHIHDSWPAHRGQIDYESSRCAAVEAAVGRILADRSDPKRRRANRVDISGLSPGPEKRARAADHRDVVSGNRRWRARWRVASVHSAQHNRSYGCAIRLQDLK